jgi:UDP-glucose 4-epimerase
MNILITGGSGFIGSHIVDVLLNKGHNVTILDIESPKYGQKCDYIKADVNDPEQLNSSINNIDYIYHLAAEANVNRFFNDPIGSNLVTSQSTINVLDAARNKGVKRVLLASTEWIYGSIEGEAGEINELTPYALYPDHLYTSSKISAELFCKNYKRLYNVNYTIIRYGIPFGERARPETVTPIFISKLLNNEEITIHGDGSQTRQFIYVKDLAEGNTACLSDKAENEIFNINGLEKITVLEIVRTLENILGKKANIKFIEDRKGNYKGRFISSEKAKQLLGWEPKLSYRNAMEIYLKNYLS